VTTWLFSQVGHARFLLSSYAVRHSSPPLASIARRPLPTRRIATALQRVRPHSLAVDGVGSWQAFAFAANQQPIRQSGNRSFVPSPLAWYGDVVEMCPHPNFVRGAARTRQSDWRYSTPGLMYSDAVQIAGAAGAHHPEDREHPTFPFIKRVRNIPPPVGRGCPIRHTQSPSACPREPQHWLTWVRMHDDGDPATVRPYPSSHRAALTLPRPICIHDDMARSPALSFYRYYCPCSFVLKKQLRLAHVCCPSIAAPDDSVSSLNSD